MIEETEECKSMIDISSECYCVELPQINLVKNKYSDYLEIVHLPDGKTEIGDPKSIIGTFLIEKTDTLTYQMIIDLDHDEKELNIHVLPLVEAA